jgi:hypothetical protein
MRCAIQSPYFLFADPATNFNGYDFEFFKIFKPIIYFPGWRKINLLRAYRRIKQLGLNPDEYPFAFSVSELNRKADVLLGFCGRPDLPALQPLRSFQGMKVYHVMDYVFEAGKSHHFLKQGGVDYVMGYTNHGEYCPFFRKFYPTYIDKVISVPFGYGERFSNKKPFHYRLKKCIAAGSVNPVEDPAVKNREEIKEYTDFYIKEKWTHKWRHMLSENEEKLQDVMDSVLPHYPATKNPKYNAAQLFNDYQLFANDEGLMGFPPARTYEGVASGAVMVASNHPSYKDLGFQDEVNCILHNPYDIQQFKEKIAYFTSKPEKLAEIALAGHLMVTKNYSHRQIALDLFQTIFQKWKGST